ncbi:stress-response protein [Serratia marcescens]|uniref:CsbD family protein n=1 Tax=Serratia TaxID=613 RepID=UPI001572BFBA|nr:stress-response protein [Serratia marcescens]ELY1863140.1 stress-response protein [Serratia marcescens]MBI6133854.1 stress-response protein [Serratia marcescens]NSM19853.1 stress-response protein [Serratia marcescens]NSM46473.1 stress-response protein [Serratia marcescens]BEM85432.1 CsbD family protein [Serratia marcescens]
MNSDIIVGRWKQLKGQVWQAWAEWSGNDCAWLAGSNDFLAGVLQEDYGRERDAVSSEKTSH